MTRRRRFILTVNVGADDPAAVARSLRELADDIECDVVPKAGPALGPRDLMNRVAGGSDAGYTAHLNEDPAWTHDRYFEAVERDIATRKDLTP